MKTEGREVIGRCENEMLIADASIRTDVVLVTLAATSEEMKLKCGSVLAVSDEDGKCSLLGGTKADSTENDSTKSDSTENDSTKNKTAAYILAEDVVTSKTGDTVAEAYQTGKFVRNALIVAEDYTLSAKDEKALRDAGIYLENAVK